MKWSLKRELFSLIVMAALAMFAVHQYPGLPDPMPSHFDSGGNINGWMGKDAFMGLVAALTVGLYLLITFIPFIDPFWKKIQPRYGLILLIRDVTIGFLAFVFVLSILAAREGRLRFELFGAGLGLLFVLIGIYMPKLPQNWFVGIRTPWTLSSDVVWKKTHVVGGRLFVLAGIVFILCSLLGLPVVIPLVCLIAISVFTGIIYPLYLFKKLPGANGG